MNIAEFRCKSGRQARIGTSTQAKRKSHLGLCSCIAIVWLLASSSVFAQSLERQNWEDFRLGVLEIRNYRFLPGTANAFLTYFEDHYIESEEALGMPIFGIYRVIGEPDRLVWFRGFANMHARLEGLNSFYSGPVWKERRQATNHFNLEYDNVRLVRPAGSAGGDWFMQQWQQGRPGVGEGCNGGSIVAINMVTVVDGKMTEFVNLFESEIKPFYEDAGGKIAGYFEVEMANNDFPALPVIQEPNTFFWITVHKSEADRQTFENALWASDDWQSGLKKQALELMSEEVTLALIDPGPRAVVR